MLILLSSHKIVNCVPNLAGVILNIMKFIFVVTYLSVFQVGVQFVSVLFIIIKHVDFATANEGVIQAIFFPYPFVKLDGYPWLSHFFNFGFVLPWRKCFVVTKYEFVQKFFIGTHRAVLLENLKPTFILNEGTKAIEAFTVDVAKNTILFGDTNNAIGNGG